MAKLSVNHTWSNHDPYQSFNWEDYWERGGDGKWKPPFNTYKKNNTFLNLAEAKCCLTCLITCLRYAAWYWKLPDEQRI